MTLQEQYNKIKAGKGSKHIFLTEAKKQFSNMLTNPMGFEEASSILKQRGVITENYIDLQPINTIEASPKEEWENKFAQFLSEIKNEAKEENIKAEAKKVDKSVEEIQDHNFDYKDQKNLDNQIGQEVLNGIYFEAKQNPDKSLDELRKIVSKNLEKDRQYYMKNAAFGIEGLGYQETEVEEVSGKYKASGYSDKLKKLVKESLIKEDHTDNPNDKYLKSIKTIIQFPDVQEDPDPHFSMGRGELVWNYLTQEFPELNRIGEEEWMQINSLVYQELKKQGLNEDHTANPNDKYVVRPCKNKQEPWAVWEGEKRVKGFANKPDAKAFADKKNKEQGLKEIGMFLDPIGWKKSPPSDNIYTKKFVKATDKPGVYVYNIFKHGKLVKTIQAREGDANAWINNAMQKDKEQGLNENESQETGLIIKGKTDLDNIDIKRTLDNSDLYYEWDSVEKYFFLPEEEDLYGALEAEIDQLLSQTEATYYIEGIFNEAKLNESYDEFQRDDKGSKDVTEKDKGEEEAYGAGVKKGEKIEKKKMKSESLDDKLNEIDRQSQIVALEAKLDTMDEMIEAKNTRLNMIDEDANLAELVDKTKIKQMQKEIKILEKRKIKMEKMYEKMCGKSYTKEEIVDETYEADE